MTPISLKILLLLSSCYISDVVVKAHWYSFINSPQLRIADPFNFNLLDILGLYQQYLQDPYPPTQPDISPHDENPFLNLGDTGIKIQLIYNYCN